MSADPTKLIDDLDALGAPPPNLQCHTCKALIALPPEVRDAFNRAIARRATKKALALVLSNAGDIAVNQASVGEHIRRKHV